MADLFYGKKTPSQKLQEEKDRMPREILDSFTRMIGEGQAKLAEQEFGSLARGMGNQEISRRLSQPEYLGRMSAQRDIAMRDRATRQARAFTEEQERNRTRNAGPGVGTWG